MGMMGGCIRLLSAMGGTSFFVCPDLGNLIQQGPVFIKIEARLPYFFFTSSGMSHAVTVVPYHWKPSGLG